MNIGDWRNQAVKVLREAPVFAGDEAFWLEDILNRLLEGLFQDKNLNANSDLSQAEESLVNASLQRLKSGEPLEQIVGYTYFYGNKIKVFPNVLIPRPDSETLVEAINEYLPFLESKLKAEEKSCLIALEIGVGSGALSISVAKLLKSKGIDYFRLMTTDINAQALDCAKINVDINKLTGCIELECNDLWPQALVDEELELDLLFTNPPYISSEELAKTDLLKFEPESALLAAEEGYEYYRRIFFEGKKYLSSSALLVMEHGAQQAERIRALAEKAEAYIFLATKKDLAGRDRVSLFLRK